MSNPENVPEGFNQIPVGAGYGFNDKIAPVYTKSKGEDIQLGFLVCEHHLNGMGMCHGGAMTTFVDLSMAAILGFKLGQHSGMPTINLSIDFLKAAKLGDWLEVDVQLIDYSRTIGRVSLHVNGPDGPVVRANGTFKIPSSVWDNK